MDIIKIENATYLSKFFRFKEYGLRCFKLHTKDTWQIYLFKKEGILWKHVPEIMDPLDEISDEELEEYLNQMQDY